MCEITQWHGDFAALENSTKQEQLAILAIWIFHTEE